MVDLLPSFGLGHSSLNPLGLRGLLDYPLLVASLLLRLMEVKPLVSSIKSFQSWRCLVFEEFISDLDVVLLDLLCLSEVGTFGIK